MIPGVQPSRLAAGSPTEIRRPKIEEAVLRQLKQLIYLKREIRNSLYALSYEALTESGNSRVYAIKRVQEILGVVKVSQDHERAIIEEIKWNIASILGDSDHFVPTLAWSYRDQSQMKGGDDFLGRIDSEGRFLIDRGLKKGRLYVFEPFIEGCHAPIKERSIWLKTGLSGIVYGLFDSHHKNLLYDQAKKKAYHIDYVQSMPPNNSPLIWGSIMRPFLRLTHMRDAFSVIPFTEEERKWIIDRLDRYLEALPNLKAFLDAFIIRKKLCYVDITQFDPDLSFQALKERVLISKKLVEDGVLTFRELVLKICPFYALQAMFIHLDYAQKGIEFDPRRFEEVGNHDIIKIAKSLLKAGVDPIEVISDLEKGLDFDKVFNANKEKFGSPLNASLSEVLNAFINKLAHLSRDAAYCGADLHADRLDFRFNYYRERLKAAKIPFQENNKWLYVSYWSLKLAVHPLAVPDKIHLLYKGGNLPLMSFEDFKKPPSKEVLFAISILDYCSLNKIKVVAADKTVLICAWAKLKRGESFLGQIHDRAEFVYFFRKLNGKRERKNVFNPSDIVFKDDFFPIKEKENPFSELDALNIPYRTEKGLAWIKIKNEWFLLNNLHGFYVISAFKGELPPMDACAFKRGLDEGFWALEWLKFLSAFNFTLSDAQADLGPVETYMIQQIKGSADFYLYKRGAYALEVFKLELNPNGIVLRDLNGKKSVYSQEDFKKHLYSI